MDANIQERDRRLALFNKLMEAENLDGLIFTSTAQQTCQMAVKYATNYPLTTRRGFACMARGKMPRLFIPTVGQQFHARALSWLPPENIVSGNLLTGVLGFIQSLPGTHLRIGLYEPDQIPVSIYRELANSGAEFVDITVYLTQLRAPKSAYELELLEAASSIAVESFQWILRHLKPGVTEQELIGGAEGFLRARGAEDFLVLTRSEKPHTFISRPKNVPVKPDGIFVYSCEVAGPGGYWSQLVRPVFMTHGCQDEAYQVLQVIREALAAGEALLRPGNRICDVDEAIAEVVKQKGCHAGVWSGHGMGADLGDGIDIGAPNKMELVPNMVLTLHPSVVGESDGLLYGNTYVVTGTGGQNLTPAYADSCYLEDLLKELNTKG